MNSSVMPGYCGKAVRGVVDSVHKGGGHEYSYSWVGDAYRLGVLQVRQACWFCSSGEMIGVYDVVSISVRVHGFLGDTPSYWCVSALEIELEV